MAKDVFVTETPRGTAYALFNANPDDGRGVTFDDADWPASDFMLDLIRNSVGPGGIGLDPDTIDGETYHGFCQPKGSGVTITMPEHLRWNPEVDGPEPADDFAMDAAPAPDRIERARSATNQTPTERQKATGNYRKGSVYIHGLHVKIENPKGTLRRGKDAGGKEWCRSQAHDYGYLKGIPGADGDPLDVFLGPDHDSDRVFVIDQRDGAGQFDEHKVMLGFRNEAAARAGYLDCYEAGWTGLGRIREFHVSQFKSWARTLRGQFDQAGMPDQSGRLRSPMPGLMVALADAKGAMAKLDIARTILRAHFEQQGMEPPTPIAAPRTPTAHLYSHDEERSKGKRQRANNAALAILRAVESGERSRESLTDEDRRTLAAYSGSGGALINAEGRQGSDYEYYTSVPVAAGMWDMLSEMGFQGGKILDPCSATGVFGATAPSNAVVDAVELSPVSGGICKLINDSAGFTTTVAPFEQVAANTPDEQYDAVVTNVPFSRDLNARGGNQYADSKYQNEPMESYFILRSIEKLKPGGLAAFITPPRVVSGLDARQQRLRRNVSLMAEFMGAYRLPNTIFGAADADTIVDVIVFRKFRRDAAEKIGELMEQNPGALSAANVLWDEFLEGRYFKGEGKRFVFGEFIPKDSSKVRDIDRVVDPENRSPADIAKLLRKFPGSRIDWAALDAIETTPITYREGDTIYQGGQLLELRNGVWVPHETDNNGKASAALLERMATAMSAFASGATAADGLALAQHMDSSGTAMDLPGWVRRLTTDVKATPESDQESVWRIGMIGYAVSEVIARDLEGLSQPPADAYPDLTEAMSRVRGDASKRRGRFSKAKDAVVALLAHARPRGAFSPQWTGDAEDDVEAVTPTTPAAQIDALLYQSGGSRWLHRDDVAAILGPDFDPLTDPDWCVSADGANVMRASDYYTGTYRAFLDRIDADIAEAADDAIRDKLVSQKIAADARLPRIDPKKISYDLRSPYVTDQERLNFLRAFVYPGFYTEQDNSGKTAFKIDGKGAKDSNKVKMLRRVGAYIKEGTVTLANVDVGLPDAQALAYLREQVTMYNAQFEMWARNDPGVQARLSGIVNNPDNLRFAQEDDEAPLSVPGLDPKVELKPYQNAFIRRMAQDFSGINGFGVGLGKTFTSLAATQHVQALGVKKKALFVVPASTLSNWYKEANTIYTSTADCMFVGLRPGKNGRMRRVPSAVSEDLQDILANKHRKVFMTFEAFESIRLRDETIDGYSDYLGTVDSTYDTVQEHEGASQRAKSRVAAVVQAISKKSGGAPYFEDMGFDTLVIDEMHGFKNGAEINKFKGAKYLSTAKPSKRAIDAMAKAWYMRQTTPTQDGVLGLTATPVTNSPLEVYSMLGLAVGQERVNAAFAGIRGADHFMEASVIKNQEEDVGIDGKAKMRSVFSGLANVEMLQRVMHDTAVIKDAESVAEDVFIPERSEEATAVSLSAEAKELLTQYRMAYRAARLTLSPSKTDPPPEPEELDALDAVMERTGEPIELIAHPFNLINKMTMVIVDPELDNRATFYNFPPEQRELAERACAEISRANLKEEREKSSPYTPRERVSTKIKTVDDEKIQVDVVLVSARTLSDDRLVLDSMLPETQLRFEAIAEKLGLELGVTIPAKIAALIANLQREAAQPRGLDDDGEPSKIVKQIVFCDILASIPKLRRAISQHAGVPVGKIAVITGNVNGAPDQIQEVQDGFNAHGDENKYQIIIANKKAEVGINLQRGTQAIHHLTIGWTPDSIEQRNGRGARQGNKTVRVAIYHYDAGGTFDSAKRKLVNVKSDWIDSVMTAEAGSSVAVTGGLSREEIDALIQAGDSDQDLARVQAAQEAKNLATRVRDTRQQQMVALTFADQMEKELKKLQGDAAAIRDAAEKYVNRRHWVDRRRSSIAMAEGKETDSDKRMLARSESDLAAVVARLDKSLTLKDSQKEAGHATFGAAAEASWTRATAEKLKLDEKINRIIALVSGLTEDGPIALDLAQRRDQLEGMIQSARDKVREMATRTGAYPADAAEKIAENKAVIAGTELFMVGDFVMRPKYPDPVIVTEAEFQPYQDRARIVTAKVSSLYDHSLLSPADIMAGARVIPRGTAQYNELCDQAAEVADRLQAQGDVAAANRYNDLNPDIASRRTSVALVAHQIRTARLPQPYFPIAIPRDMLNYYPALQSIFDAQQSVVKGFAQSGYRNIDTFYTEPSVQVTTVEGAGLDVEFNLALYAHWYAQGIRWSYVEAPLVSGNAAEVRQRILALMDWSPVVELVQGWSATTMDDVKEMLNAAKVKARDVVAKHVAESVVEQMASHAAVDRFAPVPAVNEALIAVIRPIEEAHMAKLAADQAAADAERLREQEERSKTWVVMTSNYGLTNTVRIRDFSTDIGYPAAWVDKFGRTKGMDGETARNRPDAVPSSWVLHRKVYEALMERYPAACAANNVRVR